MSLDASNPAELGLLEQFFGMISYALNGPLTAFFVATGIISNLFSIYIFLRCERGATPAIQYYLGNYVYVYPYAYTFANTTHTGSVWIVLTLTIDRYLALCQPIKHRAIGKRSRVRRLMFIVSLLAVIFSMPRFWELEVITKCDEIHNVCGPRIQRTTLHSNQLYWSIYHVVLAMMFVTLCPCLLLFVLTVRISFALRTAIAKRKSMCAPNLEVDMRKEKANCTRKEHKSNIMLVLVIAKFLISDILPTVADVLENIVGEDEFMHSPLASLFVDISNFLLVLNCSSNFWVFLIWGKRFRQSCRRLFFSFTLGIALYRVIHGSDPDLVSACGPSSFTTVHNTTKVHGIEKFARPKHLRTATTVSSERTFTKKSSSMVSHGTRRPSLDQTQILEQLEKQCLLGVNEYT